MSSAFAKLFVPYFCRDFASGSFDGAVLAVDFHLEDGIGFFPIRHTGVRQQGDEALLEGLEAAFYFTLGLWRGGYEVGDAKGA